MCFLIPKSGWGQLRVGSRWEDGWRRGRRPTVEGLHVPLGFCFILKRRRKLEVLSRGLHDHRCQWEEDWGRGGHSVPLLTLWRLPVNEILPPPRVSLVRSDKTQERLCQPFSPRCQVWSHLGPAAVGGWHLSVRWSPVREGVRGRVGFWIVCLGERERENE